jgi:hypothetical protein
MEREFITLSKHNQYEITTEFPWIVRRKSDGKIVKQTLDKSNGYYRVKLDGKLHLLHRVVGEQYILNPNNMSEIDHINRIRTDNRIENLRWVSRTLNTCNRISHKGIKYEYVFELPNGYEPFTEYKMSSGEIRKFNNLFIKMENNQPQFITDDSERHYRFLHQDRRGYVKHNDLQGKNCAIYFSRIDKPISATTTTTETTTITTAEETRTTTKTITETTKYQTEPDYSDEEELDEQANNTTQQLLLQILDKLNMILERNEALNEEEYEHYEPEEDYRK